MTDLTLIINPQAWVDRIAVEHDATTNKTHRHMLSVLHDHLNSEFRDRLADTMATLIPNVRFRGWCGAFPDRPYEGNRAQTREGYRVAMEDLGGFPPTELVLDHFLVSDDGIAMDGTLKRVMMGALLGRPELKPDEAYLTQSRLALIISFEDGLMIGEDMYWDSHTTFTHVGRWSNCSGMMRNE